MIRLLALLILLVCGTAFGAEDCGEKLNEWFPSSYQIDYEKCIAKQQYAIADSLERLEKDLAHG